MVSTKCRCRSVELREALKRVCTLYGGMRCGGLSSLRRGCSGYHLHLKLKHRKSVRSEGGAHCMVALYSTHTHA